MACTSNFSISSQQCEAYDENHNGAFVRCWRDARRVQVFTYTPDGVSALELRLCHYHANRNLDGSGRGFLILADREIAA